MNTSTKTSSQFDVTIVGGGLAGLSLAIQLADANRKVVLLERKKYPFHRVCGEYISMESWNFLERIGVPLSQMNLPRITQLRVSSLSGKVIEHKLNPGGFGISRYTLDALMASIAKSKGVDLKEEVLVKEIDEEIKSSVMIGAFGKRSNLDKKLNRSFEKDGQSASENWVGVKYHIAPPNLPEGEELALAQSSRIELHNFAGGYCGVSKVDGEKYCLCYLTKASNLQRFSGNIQQMEKELLSKNQFLKNIFSHRENFLFPEPVTISQITFQKKSPVENHWLMVGDAAGMITPLCGNGMSMALHASVIAFPIIMKFLEKKISREEMESEYATKWNKQFAARLSFGRMLQPLLLRPALSNGAISLLGKTPWLMNNIVSLTHGKSF